jgi:UrcA family protein
MSLSLTLALALLLPPPLSDPRDPSATPDMRIVVGDLDFARAAHLDEFARRVQSASRAYCDQHLERVMPARMDDPALCRAEMRRLAYRALPLEHQRQFTGTERFRAIR